jgi:6-phosphogluconolactonase
MIKPPISISETLESLGQKSAHLFVQSANKTLEKKETFDVALSGGSTPKTLFRVLAEKHAQSLPWDRVRFFWGDDRFVAPDHSESNFKMANDLLLKPLKIREQNIFRMKTELNPPELVATEYEKTLHTRLPSGCFDFALMGLGEGGHTASLFPDARPEWEAADKKGLWVCAPWIPHLKQYRITLLPNLLNASRLIVFLVSGAGKKEIFSQVMEGAPVPAQLIQPKSGLKTAHLLWMIDQAAAGDQSQAA